MDLLALQTTLRELAAERDWAALHTPKNLAMALMVEAAELAEIFQWMTPEQSQGAHADVIVQERIADEVVDVLLYLLQVADHTGVDLKRSVGRKLVKNARKHPPTRPGAAAEAVRRSGAQTHVLVDWENVQPKDTDIRALVSQVTDVWLFHGPQQKRADAHQASFGERVTLVPIARSGKNALDFHLSFYMGYIASRHPEASFVVISNDKGYGPMLEHAASLGFAASQIGFESPVAGAKTRSPAPKAMVEKPAVATKAAKKEATPKPAVASDSPAKKLAASTTPAKTLPQAVQHVLSSLKKTSSKPTKQAKLLASIKSLLGSDAGDERIRAVLDWLLASGKVEVDAKGVVSYKLQ